MYANLFVSVDRCSAASFCMESYGMIGCLLGALYGTVLYATSYRVSSVLARCVRHTTTIYHHQVARHNSSPAVNQIIPTPTHLKPYGNTT
jgi:hypothetical protein